jgi:hypothetical protein
MAMRYNKIVTGLALVNELHIRKANQNLLDVYRSPNMEQIGELHDYLSASADGVDQETALFLSLALNGKPIEITFHQLLVTLKEIEVLLFEFMWQMREAAHRDLNDWYNYLANASQSLQDGAFFDAKILMNRASQSAKKVVVENLPSKYAIRGKIEILRKGTLDAYQKIREIPIRLQVPEERHELVVEELGILIELLTMFWEQGEGILSSAIGIIIQKVNAALRSTVRGMEARDALTKIGIAIELLEGRQNTLSSGELSNWTEGIHLRLSRLRDHTLKHLVGQGGTTH